MNLGRLENLSTYTKFANIPTTVDYLCYFQFFFSNKIMYEYMIKIKEFFIFQFFFISDFSKK